MINTFFESLDDFFKALNEVSRRFQYDYIYIDAFFLAIWLSILIKKKKWNPLLYGLFTAVIVYIIDAVIWWNTPAGVNYPPGTTIREYYIGGIKMPHPIGEYFWAKFGADFMMDISYSLFAFGWLWLMFENYTKRNYREIFLYTSLFFGSWMLTPLVSELLPLNNTIVYTVRHMDTQILIWIINVFAGYSLLFIIYGTGKWRKRDYKLIGYVFLIGVLESFFMEFPLNVFHIRPVGTLLFIYELFFLFNQGAPYLWILQIEILPFLSKKILRKKEEKPIVNLVSSK
jgi:hypothetical protein